MPAAAPIARPHHVIVRYRGITRETGHDAQGEVQADISETADFDSVKFVIEIMRRQAFSHLESVTYSSCEIFARDGSVLQSSVLRRGEWISPL
jgi:hypothetical protein